MAPTQPVLATNSLPHPAAPDGYSESVEYRGAAQEMADGSVTWDLISATGKHVFVLRWHGLTAAQKATVETAYAAIKSGYSASNYTAPTGTVYTVTRDPAQQTLDWRSRITGARELVWDGELRLREV